MPPVECLSFASAGTHLLPAGWCSPEQHATIVLACRPGLIQSGFAGDVLTLGAAVAKPPALALLARRVGEDPRLERWERCFQNYIPYTRDEKRVLECVFASAPPERLIAKKRREHEELRRKNPAMEAYAPPPELDGTQRAGIPVAALLQAERLVVAVCLRGPECFLYVNGTLVDEVWPAGPLLPGTELRLTDAVEWANVYPAALTPAQIAELSAQVAPAPLRYGEPRPFGQYWAPPRHNQWAGDPMLAADGERLHLVYLRGLRLGYFFGGAVHPIEHVSTCDLKSWQTHPPAYPITSYFDMIGTGCLVPHNGALYQFANVLTEWQGTEDLHPHGQHLAISTDGEHFAKQGHVNLPGEPGIVRDEQGKFHAVSNSRHPDGAYRSSLYESDDLRSWRMTVRDFLPEAGWPPSRTVFSCECFNWFRCGDWWYIIGGRTGFWRAAQLMGPYRAVHEQGGPQWDIYDGLMVPQAIVWKGRAIMAGWVGFETDIGYAGETWGGHLVFRELMQRPDGNLELCRPAEMEPPLPPARPGSVTVPAGAGLRSVEVPLGAAVSRVVLRLEPEGLGRYGLWLQQAPGSAPVVELRFDSKLSVAQLGQAGGKFELAPEATKMGYTGHDFAILNVERLEEPFQLDLVIFTDEKSGTVLIDAMIDRRRTLITRRVGRSVSSIRFFAADCGLKVGAMRYG